MRLEFRLDNIVLHVHSAKMAEKGAFQNTIQQEIFVSSIKSKLGMCGVGFFPDSDFHG